MAVGLVIHQGFLRIQISIPQLLFVYYNYVGVNSLQFGINLWDTWMVFTRKNDENC